jgi:RNA recognition motif-containing protein
MNIFVSSLSFKAKKEDLLELFAPFGEVLSARIILNKETRRSRGYGFVEMSSQEEGQAAISALNGPFHDSLLIHCRQPGPFITHM